MHSLLNLVQVMSEVENGFRSRYENTGFPIRMVGLLFAPPETRVARDEVIPGLPYFHLRSGNHIDFFCAGYRKANEPEPGEKRVIDDDPSWFFSVPRYEEFRQQIERRCRWRYSGEADLILLNATHNWATDHSSLDFTSAIACDLDLMTKDGAIRSVRRFFEDIIQFAETAQSSDPTWGFSDEQGLRTAGSALKRVVLSLLPRQLGDDYRRAEHFAIRDISVPA